MKHKEINGISRRVQIQHRTELEARIDEVITKVENLGAHEKLTNAVVHLHDAFNELADWEDIKDKK
jgi:hypothetical protein